MFEIVLNELKTFKVILTCKGVKIIHFDFDNILKAFLNYCILSHHISEKKHV